MATFSVLLKNTCRIKTHILFKTTNISQIFLSKIEINEQHNKSNLKNTYRIKVKGKIK